MGISSVDYIFDKIEHKYAFVFMDIGAMGGVPLKWRAIQERMKIIAFEPDSREFDKLKSKHNIKYLNYALCDRTKDLKYCVTKESGRSSIFKPNFSFLSQYEGSERYQIVEEKEIPSKRVKDLDSIMEENSILDVDFIKLDTQGSELSILEGGCKNFVPKIFGAQIEAEFVRVYENQPLFRDVDEFMESNGFQLIDIRRQYWKRKDYYNYAGKGQLIFGDVLYFKNLSVFCRELSGVTDSLYAKSKIFKSILICMVYKIFDYAVAVAKSGLEIGHITSEEYEEIVLEIKRSSRKGIPMYLHLNMRFYNIINSILQKFKPRSYLGWVDSDREIGNIKDK